MTKNTLKALGLFITVFTVSNSGFGDVGYTQPSATNGGDALTVSTGMHGCGCGCASCTPPINRTF